MEPKRDEDCRSLLREMTREELEAFALDLGREVVWSERRIEQLENAACGVAFDAGRAQAQRWTRDGARVLFVLPGGEG